VRRDTRQQPQRSGVGRDRGERRSVPASWVPSIGLNANLFLDPLGWMFAGLILGIGLLILIYARFYLRRPIRWGGSTPS
jgi:multicomponent K+:H+ antiporter subunit A